VRCGLRWESAEIHWLRRFIDQLPGRRLRPLVELGVAASPLYGEHWAFRGPVPGARTEDAAVYLPGRNLLLLTLAGVYCVERGISDLYLGVLDGNPFADSRPTFFRSVETSLRRAMGRSPHIHAPFRRWTKSQVVARGRGLPLHLTFSCLQPRGVRPCGRCNKCAEKERVLDNVK
jgi:7-cyano-7-deazaguanine synthase